MLPIRLTTWMCRSLVGAVVTIAAVVFAHPVLAHTSMRIATPAPASSVGGDIDEIRLVFFGPVLDAQIEVLDPNGGVVASIGPGIVQGDSITVVQAIEPLGLVGAHQVNYVFRSADGVQQESAYEFDYLGAEGNSRPVLAFVGGGVVLALAALWWLRQPASARDRRKA